MYGYGFNMFDAYSPPQPQQVPVVTSDAGAEAVAAKLPAGSSVVAMHRDEDLMYVCSTDARGVPSVTKWRIEECQPEPKVDPGEFLTRREFMEWLEGHSEPSA